MTARAAHGPLLEQRRRRRRRRRQQAARASARDAGRAQWAKLGAEEPRGQDIALARRLIYVALEKHRAPLVKSRERG